MSFWELVLCGVVALIVLGPERLPGAIRSVSQFINGVRQFGQQMKAELGDELRVHELHQKLKDAEEKGLLNLTPSELTALAELRQAAAEVNNPYAGTQPVTTSPQAEAPPALTAVTAEPNEQKNDKPTQPQ
ncbi:Sec-independent protein translocase protein TatB [Rheinheimera sp.]|uniref:Sec-independent protein translocase protein TatB n=1 Tax=Rheinheimera sp. TaxID=1869214 RepID=UPI0027B8963F|nr:Sec-independent protein translocase protein TatB [Rheinheimera sp.]